MSIPGSLLNLENSDDDDDDFSISFGGNSEAKDNETNGIRFGLDEDT
jgi:hypothetical protein